jgi:hypothetical protein
MKRSILFFIVFIFISLAANKEINAQPQMILCNGTINCNGTADPWQEINNKGFMVDNCMIVPRFRISRCCNGGNCQYLVDIVLIQTIGSNCVQSQEDIMKLSLKFIMTILSDLYNIPQFQTISLYVKQPKCMSDETSNNLGLTLRTMNTCDPTICCQTQYQVALLWDKIRINSQNPSYTPYTCTQTGGLTCNYTCGAFDLTPDLNTDIFLKDFGVVNDACLADCFWRLDGNDNVDDNSFMGSTIDKPVVFKENNTEIMRLQNGNVGIRIPSSLTPDYPLDVRGTIKTGHFDEISGLYKEGTVTFYPGAVSGNIFHIDNRSTGNMHISTGPEPGWLLPSSISEQPPRGSQDIISFANWGKLVGIGCNPNDTRTYSFNESNLNIVDAKMNCSGPQGMLTISDELYPYPDGQSWNHYTGNNVILRLERRNNGIDDENTNYTLISAGHNSTETFKVLANGNVGIGVSNPTVPLNVIGAFQVLANGKVQIGTNLYGGSLGSEDLKLSVEGKIAAQEMIITLDDWPDFVFNHGYQLMDLNLLESFIKTNKRLPGLPNASSVEKNGIEVGNMQKILLQKIEELTLYMIELKKENEVLKNKIDEVKK